MKKRMPTMAGMVLMVTMGSLAGLSPYDDVVHGQVTYHLLIIAPDEFLDELEPLQRFKDATARPTILVGLGHIEDSFTGDEPEPVKRAIAWYESTSGIDHVMLVGDIDVFPARWQWWGLPGQEGWGASDLYYADLYKNGTTTFDAWDSNDNDLYGEIEFAPDGAINNDDIDFLPDVSVGRVPASTPAEVAAYVEKVIAYELRTTPTNPWFKTAALYTGTATNSNGLKDGIGDQLADLGFSLTKRYSDWTVPTPQPPSGVPDVIVDDLNAGVGLVNYAGHGRFECWSCLGVCSQNLTDLNNADMLPVVFAGACDTSFFAWLPRPHPYRDTDGQLHCGTKNGESLDPKDYPHRDLPHPAPVQTGTVHWDGPECEACNLDHDCLGESFLFGKPIGPTGAVAYLGARAGAQPWVDDLDRYFFEAYYSQGLTVLGDMWKYMIEQYYDQHDLADSHNWVTTDSRKGNIFVQPHLLPLFGDPSLIVGGAFDDTLGGFVWDSNGAPWFAYRRYRIAGGGISVPSGQKLTAFQGTSVLFEAGSKITAWGTQADEGLILNATAEMPVHFLSLGPDPQSERVVHGMRVMGQVRVRNGGQIKFQ